LFFHYYSQWLMYALLMNQLVNGVSTRGGSIYAGLPVQPKNTMLYNSDASGSSPRLPLTLEAPARALPVLVVEDDVLLHSLFEHYLTPHGYHVTIASTGSAALEQFHAISPAIILLDLGLPDIHGLSLCLTFRRITAAPILVVSGITVEAQKVALLDAGADDYITKPFGWNELHARLRVALRHQRQQQNQQTASHAIHQIGSLVFDETDRVVMRGTNRIRLTTTEWVVLVTLVRHRGQILSYRQLIQLVWPASTHRKTSEIHGAVSELRQKLGIWEQIETVHGVGYRLHHEGKGLGTQEG
jgi:two-component system, OmpR family, KDP operon response regulator KdpE